MTNNNKLKFNRLIHPGLSLKDILEAEEMSVSELANKINIDKECINRIIELKADITPEIALGLQKVFGISAEFWNNLQKSYEKDKIRLEKNKK